jgi:hypothetical protein
MPRRFRFAVVATALVAGLGLPLVPASAAGAGSISGVAFEDTNRNGVLDPGEAPYSGHVLYLFDGTGGYLANATTDGSGRYAFPDLAPGTYRVDYSSMTYSTLQHDWVPTTTGSLRPTRTLDVNGAATVDFGWRPISWSTTLGAPISTATDANGVRVDVYNDAISATDALAVLAGGGLLGDEGASTRVSVAYGDTDQTVTSSSYSGGRYAGFQASVYVTWDSWLGNADATLFHEYGHAWSLYFATMVQQDPGLTGYLQARGLAGDPRVDSSYAWNRKELVAEDYRQLFGDATARAVPQANPDLPAAKDVPGLADYLAGAFRQAPTSSGSSTTSPTPTTAAPVISGLAMNPDPVGKSGRASFTVSTAATVSLSVQKPDGTPVKTLLAGSDVPAGAVAATWDRTAANGRRAKSGSYLLVATATNGAGSVQQSVSFSAS